MPDDLRDFERSPFTADGKARDVYRKGTGPAVVVVSEIPGITPPVADFARRVADTGFTVFVPHLFGTPGRERSTAYIAQSMAFACVSREFSTLAVRRTSPVTAWLRALARHAKQECGGRGVGVVGMCLTGGFALAMAADDAVLAPVLSQPSLPFPLGGDRVRGTDISPADLQAVQARVAGEGLCVLGLRFTNDRAVPADRFEWLREQLGDAFVAVEIDSSKGNAHGIKATAHSVLTEDFVDEPGHPTRDALDRVLALFQERL